MNETWRAHDERVKPYVWAHRRIGIFGTVLKLGLLFAFFRQYGALNWEWYLEARITNGFLLWLAYFGSIGLAWEIVSFPLSVASWKVERKFGLSKQKFGSWLADQAKGWALGVVFGTLILFVLYWTTRQFGDYWWAVSATILFLFSIVMAQLAPVLLIPLFFPMKPMEPGPLKERLLKLCEKFKIEIKDVYHLGMGEKTEKGNAAFTGLGRTKRILIGDTLYEKFSADQVEAVFAHEVGHQVNNDLWKGIGFSTIFLYGGFFLAAYFTPYFVDREFARPYPMFLFFLVLTVVRMPMGIFQAAFSRSRERAADDFAAERLGTGGMLADALEKLTFQNWGYFKPNAIYEFLTYSHPAPWRRITFLRSLNSSAK